jgi:hypothetical protein
MREIRDGLWRWETPHPEWRTAIEWGHEVACYAASAGDDLLLVDPLAPSEGPAPFWAWLDGLAGAHRRVAVFVTIPYHVRSSAEVARRYGDKATIHGHRALARRLPADAPFHPAEPGAELPGGASVHAIGNPRRHELPVLLSSHEALAFGDAVVAIRDGLRVWSDAGEDRQAWYRGRFIPSLEPLLDLRFRHVLATHGPAVLDRGKEALREALAGDPWTTRDETR